MSDHAAEVESLDFSAMNPIKSEYRYFTERPILMNFGPPPPHRALFKKLAEMLRISAAFLVDRRSLSSNVGIAVPQKATLSRAVDSREN
jgi:hypothetical protein